MLFLLIVSYKIEVILIEEIKKGDTASHELSSCKTKK